MAVGEFRKHLLGGLVPREQDHPVAGRKQRRGERAQAHQMAEPAAQLPGQKDRLHRPVEATSASARSGAFAAASRRRSAPRRFTTGIS